MQTLSRSPYDAITHQQNINFSLGIASNSPICFQVRLRISLQLPRCFSYLCFLKTLRSDSLQSSDKSLSVFSEMIHMKMINAQQFHQVHPHEFFERFLSKGVRPDHRTLQESRPMTVALQVLTNPSVHSSSIVRLGKTTVICAITARLSKQLAMTSDTYALLKGNLIVNVSVPGVCSGKTGAQDSFERDTLVSKMISDALIQSKVLDLEQFYFKIADEAFTWTLDIQVSALSRDGTLLDASTMAVVSALADMTLPKVNVEDNVVVGGYKVALKSIPVASTIAFVNEKYALLDPSQDEISIASTIVYVISDSDGRIYAFEKYAGGLFPGSDLDVIENCILISIEESKARTDILMSALRRENV